MKQQNYHVVALFTKKIINIFFMEQIEVLLCNEVLILHILQQYQF